MMLLDRIQPKQLGTHKKTGTHCLSAGLFMSPLREA